jgi:hypothetical protein
MGRWSTGAITTGEACRIELSYLLKQGYLRKGKNISGVLSWTNGSSIQFESDLTSDEWFIRVAYQNTNSNSGEKTNHDYKIYLTTISSNLGKGEVLYFICPQSGKRCRILYKCYGSLIWKSRNAYMYRIYYDSQVCSKYDYHNTQYWSITKKLERLYKRGRKNHYRGNYTRLMKRVEQLEYKQKYHDKMRWLIVPQSILKMVNNMGLASAEELF